MTDELRRGDPGWWEATVAETWESIRACQEMLAHRDAARRERAEHAAVVAALGPWWADPPTEDAALAAIVIAVLDPSDEGEEAAMLAALPDAVEWAIHEPTPALRIAAVVRGVADRITT